jgi:hypothetical protein
LLVVDVELHEGSANAGVVAEGRGHGDAGKLALEVGGVADAVFGVVEEGIGVVEDVPL